MKAPLRTLPAVLLPVLLLACATPGDARPATQAPPPPVRVPENSSEVTAEVFARQVWEPGALDNVSPPIGRGQTVFSLQVKVLTVVASDPDVTSLATVGMEIDVFSLVELDAELVGKTIAATLVLTSANRKVRWFASDLTVVE